MSAQKTVDRAYEELTRREVTVGSTRLDTPGNLVIVTVDGDVAKATVVLGQIVDPSLIVVEQDAGRTRQAGEKVDYLDAPPLRGGQHITTGLSRCTSAFVGYRPEVVAGITTYNYFMLTAGHCGDIGTTWTQAGFPMGRTNASTFRRTSTDADASSIPFVGNARSNQVLLNRSGGINTYANITSVETIGSSSDQVGQRACQYGTTTAFSTTSCGTMSSRSVTVNYPAEGTLPAQQITGMRCNSFQSEGGDSGGAVLFSGQAKGSVVGTGSGCLGLYTHVRDAMRATGVSAIKTTAASATP